LIVGAQLVLAVVLVALFFYVGNVQEESRKADRLLITENCRRVEELKGVVRQIMVSVIAFNLADATPPSLRRAEAYQRIVDGELASRKCNH
jgi:hypothetical protein